MGAEMKLTVIVDNETAGSCGAEHGLSLYLEACGQKLLFDTGQSGLFERNAEKLGISLDAVDICVLSHGHYDHGGGLPRFLEINTRAGVYMRKEAFGSYFAERGAGGTEYIGIDESLKCSGRITAVEEDREIAQGLFLFSGVRGERLRSRSNDVLLSCREGVLRHDSFLHEQNLLITEGGKRILVTGCAHRGIANILERAVELAGGPMDAVVGGFHLSNIAAGSCEPEETIDGIAAYLLAFPTKYYTCHCTGRTAYEMLKERMGESIRYIAAGESLEI